MADLEDNMNLSRIRHITAKDLKRLERYHCAWNQLRANMGEKNKPGG
jgi:hypothetical protein